MKSILTGMRHSVSVSLAFLYARHGFELLGTLYLDFLAIKGLSYKTVSQILEQYK